MSPTASAWILTVAVLLAVVLAATGFFALLIWVVFRRGKPVWAFLLSVSRSAGQGVRENPDVKSLASRHPTLFSFVQGRFARGDFRGWPTTLLAAAFLYVLLLFLGSVEDFLEGPAAHGHGLQSFPCVQGRAGLA